MCILAMSLNMVKRGETSSHVNNGLVHDLLRGYTEAPIDLLKLAPVKMPSHSGDGLSRRVSFASVPQT